MAQLSEVRDNMRRLNEQLKEVSDMMSPTYLLPTEFSARPQILQRLLHPLSPSFATRSTRFVQLVLRLRS